jgi:hypothetical protein
MLPRRLFITNVAAELDAKQSITEQPLPHSHHIVEICDKSFDGASRRDVQVRDLMRASLSDDYTRKSTAADDYIHYIHYHRLGNKTRGGIILMLLFFYSAFVVGIVVWVETGAENVLCTNIGECTFVLMRLTFYDGDGNPSNNIHISQYNTTYITI